MIARIWHGKTSIENFEAYTMFLKEFAIPEFEKTKGFKGLTFLRSVDGAEGHFNVISYWENLEVIKNFAGNDFEKPRYYPQDNNFLLEFEEKVKHYEVFANNINANMNEY